MNCPWISKDVRLLRRPMFVKTWDKTTRSLFTCQDIDIYIMIRIHTVRLVYVYQDSHIYIKICVYTSRFVILKCL